jgi:hypothetical protein
MLSLAELSLIENSQNKFVELISKAFEAVGLEVNHSTILITLH